MRPELLAPAGSFDALRAAVEAGADAVYMAGTAFNARRNAKNFTDEELASAIAYCRERGVQTHITLNILLTDEELMPALAYAERLAALGADAIIVADIGMARLLSRRLPDLPIHASTQLTLCNPEGVLMAEELGFRRVVLSRELSLADISRICQSCSAEIEVFAHGALCMCYSGQCYMSALIGRRSGNRGLCAQPCRLPYTLSAGKAVSTHPLSLKDLNLSHRLEELSAAGVRSLKLEGRMKSPDYVSAVTGVYADCLAQRRKPTPEESARLHEAFSRDGFTDGYLDARRGPSMFGIRREDAPRPPSFTLREGHERPRVPVTLTLSGFVGQALTLTADDGERTVQAQGDVLCTARTPTDANAVSLALAKTGGTPYIPCVSYRVAPEAHVSLSAAKALRRQALQALSERRKSVPPPRLQPLPAPMPACEVPPTRFTVEVQSLSQLTEEVLALRPARILIPAECFEQEPSIEQLCREHEVCIQLPTVARPSEMEQVYRLASLAAERGARGAYVSNLGMIRPARRAGLTLYGDTGLNVFNQSTAQVLAELGFAEITVSFELPLSAIGALASPLPLEAVAYGHLPAMLCENCIVSNAGACQSCGSVTLRDRTGAQFPVLRAFGCRSSIRNAHVLWLCDRTEDLCRCGISRLRLCFTCEDARTCSEVARAYACGAGDPPAPFTRGLYRRGLE